MSLVTLGDLEKSRRAHDLQSTLAGIGKKYLVMSGKGGVGKTTVAVNLAAALAAAGAKVGLLDVDLHGPSAALALGADAPLKINEDEKLTPVELDFGLKIVTIQGLLKNRDEAVIWRGPRKIRAIQQFFSETAWGRLDYLIIDSPPGTGDEPMAVLSTVDDVKPIAVTSGSRLSIGDVAKSLNFVRVMGREPFGLVDNQSWYVCPKCGEETDLYDRKASQALADEYNVPLLASLPMDLAAARAAEEGRPLVWSRPEHPFSVMVKDLAERL